MIIPRILFEPQIYFIPKKFFSSVYVTSSSSILNCSNSEHWSKKRTQSGSIHSIILDVYADRQSAQNFPFRLSATLLDSYHYLPSNLLADLQTIPSMYKFYNLE